MNLSDGVLPMNAVKHLLEESLQQLDQEQTQEVLAFVRQLRTGSGRERVLDRLKMHSTMVVPSRSTVTFPRVEPIAGTGVQASDLLIEDRR